MLLQKGDSNNNRQSVIKTSLYIEGTRIKKIRYI